MAFELPESGEVSIRLDDPEQLAALLLHHNEQINQNKYELEALSSLIHFMCQMHDLIESDAVVRSLSASRRLSLCAANILEAYPNSSLLRGFASPQEQPEPAHSKRPTLTIVRNDEMPRDPV